MDLYGDETEMIAQMGAKFFDEFDADVCPILSTDQKKVSDPALVQDESFCEGVPEAESNTLERRVRVETTIQASIDAKTREI